MPTEQGAEQIEPQDGSLENGEYMVLSQSAVSKPRLSARPQPGWSFLSTRHKSFYITILSLLFLLGAIVLVVIPQHRARKEDRMSNSDQEGSIGWLGDKSSSTDMEESQNNAAHAFKLMDNDADAGERFPQMRATSEKRTSSERLGRMKVYIREQMKDGRRGRPQKFRFPVARYSRRRFPLRGPFLSFTPWMPIFADRLTRQTIICPPTGGIYILPPLINFYGEMFSIAELIASGYASLVSSGAPEMNPANVMSSFQPIPLYGTGIPTINRVTGGFVGGIRTEYESFSIPKHRRLMHSIDSSSEMEKKDDSDDDDDDNHAPSRSYNNHKKPYARPRSTTTRRPRTRSSPQNVLACPDGLVYSSTLTTITLPTSLSAFKSIVGDFFNSTWYSYPVQSTIGPRNQIGSIRVVTDITTSLVFRDTLIEYESNAHVFKMAYKGPGDEIGSVDYGNFVLGSYVERLTGRATCHDSAVVVTFGIDFCGTNISTARQVLIDGHILGIQQVQTLLNIGNFTTCSVYMKDKDTTME